MMQDERTAQDQPVPIAPTPAPEEASPAATTDDGTRLPSRKAAWIAMGAVMLALGLIWMAPGIGDLHDWNDGAFSGHEVDAEDAEAIGREARLDFTLKDMHGTDVALTSFKGQVILLNFWATWCAPCRVEIPDLIALQEKYPDDLVVLGLSVDDTAEKLIPYAADMRINYPVLVGNGRQDVQDAFGPLWGIPVSVIIDRDGRIAAKHSGIRSKEQFEQEIKALL
jgi:thiol-disulfide isomerase/thioredoxin